MMNIIMQQLNACSDIKFSVLFHDFGLDTPLSYKNNPRNYFIASYKLKLLFT